MSSVFSKSMGKPIQGVSQQDPTLRIDGQANEQLNVIPDPVDGAARRVPTHFKYLVDQYDHYAAFTDAGGEKILMVDSGKVDLYDVIADAVRSVTVSVPALAYLNDNMSTSMYSLRAAALEDDTYITNPSVTVEEDTSAVFADRVDDAAMLYCLGGDYGVVYTVDVVIEEIATGTETTLTATYTTPDGGSSADSGKITSVNIITELDANWSAPLTGKLVTTRKDDHLLIEVDSDYELKNFIVNDGYGGDSLLGIYKEIEDIGDLPRLGVAGQVITLKSRDGDANDTYFEYVPTIETTDTGSSTFGLVGSWTEATKIGSEYALDFGTMPVRLYEDGGTLFCDVAEWQGRQVGDEESSKEPSFVGNQIRDLKVIQSRMTFIATSSTVFSRPNKPKDLWLRSVFNQPAPDDAVDGQADSSRGELTFAAVSNGDLAVFSRLNQYVVAGNVAITPTSIGLTPATSLVTNPFAPPINVGQNLYVVTKKGDFSGLVELFRQDLTFFQQEVSEHVPKYVRGEVLDTCGLPSQSTAFIHTDYNPSQVYAYRFMVDGTKRTQSAWYKLDFTKEVRHVSASGNSLIVITRDAELGKDIIEKMDWGISGIAGLDFIPHLDRYKEYTLGADAEVTLDDLHRQDGNLIISTTAGKNVGMVVASTTDAGTGVTTVFNNLEEGDTVLVGQVYESRYSPTYPRVMDRDGMVIQVGSLKVAQLYVNINNTGSFFYDVESTYGQKKTGEFVPRKLNDPFSVIGKEVLRTKQVRIGWGGVASEKNATFYTKAHTPMTISYIEYEGDLRLNKKRS